MLLVNENKLDIYETMLLIRASDFRMIETYKKGEFEGHMLPCMGQEAIPATLAKVYTQDDFLVTGHRGGGHYIARGCDYNAMWAELYGRVTGITKGRGGHLHLMDMSKKAITGNAVVGQQWGIATGAGFVAKNRGVMVFAVGGEGSTNRGVFHESMNMAAVQKLPILYIIEFNDNQMFSESSETTALVHVYQRAAAYGMEGATVDGNDPLAIYKKATEYAEMIRAGKGPCLLECVTTKWTDSVSNIRNTPEKIAAMKHPDIDAITRFETHLRNEGILDDSLNAQIKERVATKLNEAIKFALSSRLPEIGEGNDEVYSQMV